MEQLCNSYVTLLYHKSTHSYTLKVKICSFTVVRKGLVVQLIKDDLFSLA